MRKQPKAYLALLFICIIWGTTYLAIRIAVLHYPPFLFAATRQILAGIIIMGIGLAFSRRVDLSLQNLKNQFIVGFLLITIGNGLVSWAEKYVPSGVAALMCSTMPISSVIINWISSEKEKLNVSIVTGMILGFAGVALIFRDNLKDLSNPLYLTGIIALLIATSSWAWGSILNKKRKKNVNPVFNSGLQLAFGSVFLFIGSGFFDSYRHIDISNTAALWSFIYLLIFGSVLAYTAYMYALKELPVGLVAIYAYINPMVAVVLGYFILKEPFTWFTVLALFSIVAGVYFVNKGYQRSHKPKEDVDPEKETVLLSTANTSSD